jgi:hypothetical protein
MAYYMLCRFHTGTVKSFALALGVLFVLAAASPLRAASQAKGELYAVVVGLTKFQDPQIPHLTVSDKDAKDFYSFLEDQKHLFSKAHLTLLTNEQATRDNVTSAMRDGLKPAGKDDCVVIFLSGHGAADPKRADEYYFITYDTRMENLYGTAVWMNQKALFAGVDSDRVLLLSDACHSGGFNPGLEKAIAKEAGTFFSLFQDLKGRVALASSRPDERSYEDKRFGNSLFTHYLIKGLRGEAVKDSSDGNVTAQQLYEYVYHKVREATKQGQNPQLYCVKGKAEDISVFRVPVYNQPLKVKVQYVWKDDQGGVGPLTNESVVKSGQRFGCQFRPESDCYVYIFWWDSSGGVGRLFPDDRFKDGSGAVKAGRDYWVPAKHDGKHWFVLDKNVGEETFYFLASRDRNPRIEALYGRLRSMSQAARQGTQGKDQSVRIAAELDRLMGVEPKTVPDQSVAGVQDAGALFEAMENEIKVSGAEAVYRVNFKHVAP